MFTPGSLAQHDIFAHLRSLSGPNLNFGFSEIMPCVYSEMFAVIGLHEILNGKYTLVFQERNLTAVLKQPSRTT